MITKGIFSFCAFLLAASAGAENLERYRLNRYSTSAENCEAERVRIAAAFEKAGASVFHAKCEAAGKAFDLEVSYIATGSFEIVSTVERYPYSTQHGFRSEAACRHDLETERRNFRDLTRLEPLVAYCAPKDYPSLFQEYRIRIDAMGVPANRPFTFERMVLPRLPKDVSELVAEIQGTESDRIKVSRVNFFPDIGGHSISLHYYADKRVCLGLEKIGQFFEPDGCQRYAGELKSILKGSKETPVALICGPWSRGAEAWLLSPRDRVVIRTEEAPQAFESSSACEGAKAGILQFYGEKLGRTVLGGFCQARADGKSSLSVVQEKKAPKDCY